MKLDGAASLTRNPAAHKSPQLSSLHATTSVADASQLSLPFLPELKSVMMNPLNIAVSLTTGCFLSLNTIAPQGFAGSLLGALAVAGLVRLAANKVFGTSESSDPWPARRFWMGLNVGNHAIYAVLFVFRSLFYTGAGGSDRPFFFESYFLGWLSGPSFFLPKLMGWPGGEYNQAMVLVWMKKVNATGSGAYPAWIAPYIGSPAFMYYYQIAEGIFHLMIVFGGLRLAFKKGAWPPKERSTELRLFRSGLLLELLIMDIPYVIAFSCLPFLTCPGHRGLTTLMMLIHHVNVLPDLMCGFYEWRARRSARKA